MENNISFIAVNDDLLDYNLRAGDHVVVDRTTRQFAGDGLYLIGVAEDPVLRRAQRDPLTGLIRLSSGSTTSFTEIEATSLPIMGRAMGFFRRIL